MRALAGMALAVLVALPAAAGNIWEWHWDTRVVTVGDNVGPEWDDALRHAVTQWDASPALDVRLVAGRAWAPGDYQGCYNPGGIEVCGADLPEGWIAVTHAWPRNEDHVTAMGIEIDFRSGWTAAGRRNALCHELGHALGLHHRQQRSSCLHDDFDASARPDAHDYAMLGRIYAHRD